MQAIVEKERLKTKELAEEAKREAQREAAEREREREEKTAPKPVRILEPSKCIRQWVESGAGGRYWVSAQSTRKSASACDLMAV